MGDINVADRIKKFMEQRGMNLSEIAARCGFSISKMSKILSGDQKITTEDLITIGYALRTNPALLISPNMSDVEWRGRELIPLQELFGRINKTKDEDAYAELLENELPYTISQYLGLKDSGKTIYSSAKHRRLKADSSSLLPVPRVVITDSREGQLFSNQLTVGYWFTEDRTSVYLAIHYMKRAPSREKASPVAIQDMRDYFKALFPPGYVIEDGTRMHLSTTGHNLYGGGTIICKKYDFITYYGEEKLKSDLHEIYDEYLLLLDTATKRVQQTYENIYQSRMEMERKENPQTDSGSFAMSDLDRIMPVNLSTRKTWAIKPRVSEKALLDAGYKCEIDESHETFIDRRTGKQYLETHPLIPFTFFPDFKNIQDIPANLCCVCPNCGAKLRYASDVERQELLMQLYLKHKAALKEEGIEITPMQLFKYYGMS